MRVREHRDPRGCTCRCLTTLFPPPPPIKKTPRLLGGGKSENAKTAHPSTPRANLPGSRPSDEKRPPILPAHPPFRRYEKPLCARAHLGLPPFPGNDGFPFAYLPCPGQRTFFRPSCFSMYRAITRMPSSWPMNSRKSRLLRTVPLPTLTALSVPMPRE